MLKINMIFLARLSSLNNQQYAVVRQLKAGIIDVHESLFSDLESRLNGLTRSKEKHAPFNTFNVIIWPISREVKRMILLEGDIIVSVSRSIAGVYMKPRGDD